MTLTSDSWDSLLQVQYKKAKKKEWTVIGCVRNDECEPDNLLSTQQFFVQLLGVRAADGNC